MKYLDEYRDDLGAEALRAAIARTVTRPWVLMEVCGGQTHTIVKYGIDRVLPPEIELVHGPGCPVCVTSLETIDRAHAIAQTNDPGTRRTRVSMDQTKFPSHKKPAKHHLLQDRERVTEI